MFIGIDFDNTIADYDNLFVSLACEKELFDRQVVTSKKEIRDRLLSSGKKNTWRLLQSIAYGSRMKDAEMAPGFADFVSTARKHRFKLSIVSHKSTLSNLTNKGINLRKAAVAWMENNKFFSQLGFEHKDIFFETTRQAKVRRIGKLNCTHFIDDLEEVFQSTEWPQKTERLLLDKTQACQMSEVQTFSDWREIINALFLPEFNEAVT